MRRVWSIVNSLELEIMASGGGPGWRCIHCGFEIPSATPLKLERCPILTCGKLQVLEQVPSTIGEEPKDDFNLVSKTKHEELQVSSTHTHTHTHTDSRIAFVPCMAT